MASVSRTSGFVCQIFGAERFGDNQGEFVICSNAIIEGLAAKMRDHRADPQRNPNLFSTIVDDLGVERRKLAVRSPQAGEFGRRRGREGVGAYHYTPFFWGCEPFNRQLILAISHLVDKMGFWDKGDEWQTKIFKVEQDGAESERITVEIVPMSFFKNSGFTHEEIEKDDIESCRQLRESDPARYDRFVRLHCAGIVALYPEKDVQGAPIPAHTRTHVIYLTLQKAVVRGGKKELMPLARRVSWVNRADKTFFDRIHTPDVRRAAVLNVDTEKPELKLLNTVPGAYAVHGDQFLIDDWIEVMGELFDRAVCWQPDQGMQELKKTVAELRYLFANVMPFCRGSGSIGEWIELAIYLSHGFTEVKHTDISNGDFEALSCLSFEQFFMSYDGLIDLGVERGPASAPVADLGMLSVLGEMEKPAVRTSQAIYRKVPGRYGGQQDDYNARTAEIITRFAGKMAAQRAVKGADMPAFFGALVRELGALRQQIAMDHMTENAKLFGQYRGGIEGAPGIILATPLFRTYDAFNLPAVERIAKLLEKIPHTLKGFTELSKEFTVRTLDKKERVKVDILDDKKISELGHPSELQSNDPKFYRDLKKADPAKYRDLMKLQSVLFQTFTFPSKDDDGARILAHLKSHYVVIDLQREVVRNGKPALMTYAKRICWLYFTYKDDPVERFVRFSKETTKRSFSMHRSGTETEHVVDFPTTPVVTPVHADRFLIDDWMQVMGTLFEKAMQWKPEQGEQALKDTVAELRYLFANVMPFDRGNGAVGEWLELAIYQSHGYTQVRHKDESVLHVDALSSLFLMQFLQKYDSLIELGPRD